MTNPQHDGELTDSPLRPPLAVRWDVRLGTVTSNVLVADGRVIFVRTDATNAPQLTALDAASGAHLWSVATPAARIAYEGGRVFATQGTGVAAFSAQTGARLWIRDLQVAAPLRPRPGPPGRRRGRRARPSRSRASARPVPA
jgi:outer membrane protein assembly factor BamB